MFTKCGCHFCDNLYIHYLMFLDLVKHTLSKRIWKLLPTTTPTINPAGFTPEQFQQFLAAIRPPAPTPAIPTTTEEKKDDNVQTLGLSASAYAKLLSSCGLMPGQDDELPQLWVSLAEKNLSKALDGLA